MDLDDAEALARRLLAAHGLHRWTFRWDRAVRRAGQTRFDDRTITLSRRLTALHAEAEVRDTLLHEIAHALVGPRHGHDAVWRRTARSIGASGTRCLAADSERIEGRWRGVCPAGHVVTRHRVPTRVTSCRECAPRFDPSALHSWTRDGAAVPLHPAYVAELDRIERQRAAPEPTVGDRVRIRARGRFDGRRGTVVARRRTRVEVRLDDAVVTVPVHLVELAR